MFGNYVKGQILLPNEAREMFDLPQREGGEDPLELNARAAADARANISGNRARDTERTNNQSDSPTTIAGRNPQGEGRASQ